MRWAADNAVRSIRDATLDSPKVQAFIKNAHDYHRVYYGTGLGSQQLTGEILNVTGKQIVNGNRSSGYVVS